MHQESGTLALAVLYLPLPIPIPISYTYTYAIAGPQAHQVTKHDPSPCITFAEVRYQSIVNLSAKTLLPSRVTCNFTVRIDYSL